MEPEILLPYNFIITVDANSEYIYHFSCSQYINTIYINMLVIVCSIVYHNMFRPQPAIIRCRTYEPTKFLQNICH
jgi:hypothetical protein